jgi:opacity protein-like surface antigen
MKNLRLILTAIALTFCSNVFAEDAPSTFSGPYLSLGAGFQYNNIEKENVRAVSGFPSIDQPNASNNDFVGRIQAGYGRDLSEKFNFSVGVFYDIGGNKVNDIKATFYQDNVKQSIENTVGVFIAPGYYVNKQSLLFVKAGYVRADKEYTRYKQELPDVDININLRNSVDGYLWGVGVKHLVSENVFVGADFTRCSFGKSSSVANLNGLEVEISSKAEQTNVLFSLGYQF